MIYLEVMLLALSAIPALLVAANLTILRRTARYRPTESTLVSILIPARNEEKNIGAALDAALASVGVPIEILVMDDGSTDSTAEIVLAYCAKDRRVRLLTAPPLEEGWTGKIHSCHHLSLAARGTHLLFVDADVRISPRAAADLVGHSEATGAALVSAVPRQVMASIGEILTVPTINLVLLGYLPIGLMRLSLDPGLGAACGQLICVERNAYHAVGGHKAIRFHLHDGIQLARLFRRKGRMTDLISGESLASCRMYSNLREAWAGFSKNAHEGMATPVSLPIWTMFLCGGHVLPIALVFYTESILVFLAVVLSLGTRAAVTVATRENMLSIPFHPLTILVSLGIQWSALFKVGAVGKVGWKGRHYPHRVIHERQ
ncbi:glycosyltransferase [Microvirga rosea]|uniref:glycosyltransferase n=1 Tax=Microvirga rosea TaxID=2715425 RepID=UPI001D0A2D5C|nr:glycosyltransferase family 2 protein [Microvirga rosea]MCB8822986.1 glycosyltransferase [Microvirga rosea]